MRMSMNVVTFGIQTKKLQTLDISDTTTFNGNFNAIVTSPRKGDKSGLFQINI